MNPYRICIVMLVLTVTGLSGCIGADPSLPEDPAPEARTLESPPDLQVGEWWTIEVDNRLSDEVYTSAFVVTDRTDGTASIGMPADEFEHVFFILHLPPLGVVDLDTFSWNVMGHGFDALKFPLQKGQEWTTVFHGPDFGWDVQAEVTKVDGQKAEVSMIGDNVLIEFTYDAELGMISEFDADAYGVRFKVTDHGFGHEGTVKTPSNIDLGFVDGRLANLIGPPLTAGAPVFSVDVDHDVSHGTLALMVSGPPETGAPGVYRASVTAPDGTPFESTFTHAPGGPAFIAELHGHDAVQGTWDLEFQSAGPGLVAAELIVYDLEETTLGAEEGHTH